MRDERLLDKWPPIRQKGMLRFTLTRGIALAVFVYAAWAAATLAWDRDLFDEDVYRSRFWYYGLLYLVWGLVTGALIWRSRERRYAEMKANANNHPYPAYLMNEKADRSSE